jgi:hypothetical protein
VNGPEVQQKLSSPDSKLAQMLSSGRSDSALLEELYLSALARKPSPREKDRLLTRVGRADNRQQVYEDIVWAMLNSKEFLFNH